jgi:hypothetical protein
LPPRFKRRGKAHWQISEGIESNLLKVRVAKREKKKENPFKLKKSSQRKEILLMRDDTAWRKKLPEVQEPMKALESFLEQALEQQESTTPTKRRRGQPPKLLNLHLAMAILITYLHGWQAQREVWRRIVRGFGPYAGLILSDQAVYNRLSEQGNQVMFALFTQISGFLRTRLAPYQQGSLASSFCEVLAMDESQLDQVCRWLWEVRGLPRGDEGLLPGRLAGLFDVRLQQWKRLDVLEQALTNSRVHAPNLLSSVRTGALLLFDRGYYGFEWFDRLTREGYFWISRIVNKGSYRIEHILVQKDGYFEALVYLGAYRADQAAFLVRLVTFRSRGRWYRYLSNVLDPHRLTGTEIAQLYARRWDIELAFRLLKDHLHLNVLWSAKWEVIVVQIWASAILAQGLHALQVLLAAEAGVEVFDVSLALLLKEVPSLLACRADPIATLNVYGVHLGIIRPSTRLHVQVPPVCWQDYCWPPLSLPLWRPPRYAHKPAGNAKQKKRAS